MNMKNFRKDQWLMLLVTMFCYLFFYTGRHNFGWAAKDMAAELNISYTTIGWISFSMLIGYAIGQLVNGNLADHFGARKMVPLGAFLSISANIGISYASNVYLILVLWTLNGYFQSMAWAPGSKLISNWWRPEERGKGFGFYTMAAGSSSAVTYLLSILLLQQEQSWRYLFRLPVLLLLAAAIIFFLIARDKPSDKGYPDLSEKNEDNENTSWQERYKVVLSNRRFLIASLAIGFQSMARYGLIFWVPVHFLGQNWRASPNNLWVTLLMPVGMAIGALTFGNLSDSFFKGNRPRSIAVGMSISAVIAMFIFFTHSHNMVLNGILMFSAGFFVYGVQANFWPMCPDLLGRKYMGTGIGIMNMSAYLFAAMGEPMLGKIIDITHNTSFVFLAISIISLLCTFIISFIRYKKKTIEEPVPEAI